MAFLGYTHVVLSVLSRVLPMAAACVSPNHGRPDDREALIMERRSLMEYQQSMAAGWARLGKGKGRGMRAPYARKAGTRQRTRRRDERR